MPQGQQRKNDFSDFNEVLSRPAQPAQTGDFSDFNAVLGQPQEPEKYSLQWFRKQLGLGAEALGQTVADVAMTGAEIVREGVRGNFAPLTETAELVGRGALKTFTTRLARDPQTGAFLPTTSQDEPIAQVRREQAARREAAGDVYFRGAAIETAKRQAEEAKDPSLAARVVRGVPQALPYVGAAVASGGSSLALGGTGAAMSLAEPERMAGNVALSVAPLPPVATALRAGRDAVRRVLGRGAEQVIEAEARAAGRGAVTGAVDDMARVRAGAAPALDVEAAPTLRAVAPSISSQIRATGPAIEEAAIRASGPSANLNAAISAAAKEVPESTMRRALGELSSFPRAMMSAGDISAPFRQGAILSAAPSRWGEAIKATGRMFQAFKPQHYERITKEIANHADANAADDAGLFLAFKTPEEFFTSRLAAKVPGVTASQRAYETYLDSLRMSTFSQYKRLIDKGGLSADDATRAYQAAATWINYATGRGSLGKNFDKAVPLLSQFLFAPRYAASRFNVLNPVMYWRNYRDPATRAVGKQQMKDLVTYLGAVATTMGLAKAAGLDVGLNPSKGDFLKIRYGTKTYDPGAGLVQVMRFAIRAGYDLFRAAKGEKAEWGQDAGSLALKFIRSKLAPIPSYAWDFFSRRTYEGKPFTPGQAALGVVERTTPLAWGDFVEALYTEGIGSAAGTLPGFAGIGVQSYTEPGGFIEQAAPVLREYTRVGRQLPEIRRIKDESDEQFNARVKVFGEALQQYGVGLVESNEYRQADAATKDKALDLLPRRIGSALMRQGEAWQLQPRVLIFDAKDSLQQQQSEPRRLYGVGGERLR